MRRVAIALCCLFVGGGTASAAAATCANPNAIGTSRVITVDPTQLPLIGSMQYRTTLPLKDHEVVLTFDDGPLPPYSTNILDTLAANCVKVTYFLIGRQASAFPDVVRRMFNEGHAIGTHSQNHPLTFHLMSMQRVQREVDDGIASVAAALGDPRAEAPFFRIPGLLHTKQVEDFLAARSLAVWSADVVADDWFRHVTARDIVHKAMSRLEEKGRGVLLLHDIHPATAQALPVLLKELKAHGYRIVQAVPAGPRPTTLPDLVASSGPKTGAWPRVAESRGKHERLAKVAHRTRSAAHDGRRDTIVTASISKKKRRAKTAEADHSWMTLFQR